jgi:protoporphyrinogen oxidase
MPLQLQEETAVAEHDCIVIGAGVSGLVFASNIARAGRSTLVLEAADRIGGCIRTWRTGENFWLELGAHTAYNSYAPLLQALAENGGLDRLLPRRKLGYRFIGADGALQSPLARLNILQAAAAFPFGVGRDKRGRSVADWFGALLGRGNYRRLLAPAFAAVLSQPAEEFPAEWLFRRKPRMREAPRSYTFPGGLQGLLEAIADGAAFELRRSSPVRRIERRGSGFNVHLDGEVLACRQLAVATPVDAAAALLQESYPRLAGNLAAITIAETESLGVVVEGSACRLPPLAGLMAVDDAFWSVVSRDVVAHPNLRGFTFHFRPARLDREGKLARIAQVLGVKPEDCVATAEAVNRLPVVRVEHVALAGAIKAELADEPLALLGNYLNGLSIGDCAQHSAAEAARLLQR